MAANFQNGSLLYKSAQPLTTTLSPYMNITQPFNNTDDFLFGNITESMVPLGDRQTPFEKAMIFTVFSAISFLGILFNIITIIIFTFGKRSSGRDIRILILNLAAVDMVYAISGPVPAALEINGVSFVRSVAVCKLWRFTYILSAYGSPLANLGIAIERLIILFSPARTLRLRNRQTVMLIIIGSLWAFNFAITAEYLVSPTLDIYEGTAYCISNTYMNREHPKLFNWLLVVKFCVPSILIMVIYTIIGVKLTMCGPIGTISMDAHLKKQSRARNQMVKMLSIVATITLLAYLPYNLYSITYEYDDPLDNVYKGEYFCEIVLFAIQLTNGFTSPLVYLGFDRYFKRDLYDMFGCWYFVSKSASSQPTQTTTTARATRVGQPPRSIHIQEPPTTETEIRTTARDGKSAKPVAKDSKATVKDIQETSKDIKPAPKESMNEKTWLKTGKT